MTIEEAIESIENDIEVSCWATDIVIEELRRLQKENEELKEKIIEVEKENQVQKAVIFEDSISKDKIREKIDNRITTVENLLDEMVDKDIGCINISYLSKKEKEEVINKRNCLIVQKATLINMKKDLLKEE